MKVFTSCITVAVLATAVFPGLYNAAPGAGTPATRPADIVTNSIGMKFVLIPPGRFVMGSDYSEKGREEDETPHEVVISRPFYLGMTEVTQAQWFKVMGRRAGGFQGDDLPVESISWDDAVAFCRKLSALDGRTYRLPTEAEWEYACRAGSAGRFSGDAVLADQAWTEANSDGRTHPVGTKKPNAWGLYDMHGNVAEWCADWYGPYPDAQVVDPAGPREGKARVVRGGSWASFDRGCRSASRSSVPPSYQTRFVGLRVVMETRPQTP